jgi:GPI ethanolamine phosphate transferase 3 subunit O
MDMFGMYFTNETHYPSHNIRDLDTIDAGVYSDLQKIIVQNDTYDLLVTHFLGIDHAGHTFYANHSEIERKVIETEKYIEDIINLMPEDATLLLYGDHGMTNDGNHGGGT